jgi:uncharacterized protein YndB with AHSA1/START domain
MATTSDFHVTTGPSEVIMTRTIDAPRELVFDAFTKAEHLAKWFGPHGFRTTAESDPKPHGKFRVTMHGTDALPEQFRGDYPVFGEYIEFVRPTKLVYTSHLDDHSEEWKAQLKKDAGIESDEVLRSTATVTFDDASGKTKVTLRATFASNAIRDGYVKTGMNEGWGQMFERLETHMRDIRTISATRVLDAPRELVWKVFTDPKHIAQWWGPNGFTNTIDVMDVRPGGEWNFIMHGPDGTNYRNESVYEEVVEPERLVFRHGPSPIFRAHIEFVERGNKTELNWRMVFETPEERDRTVEIFHADEGLKQNLEKLQDYVVNLQR